MGKRSSHVSALKMKGPNWDSGHTATSDARMADGVSTRGRGRGSIAFGRGNDDRGVGGARAESVPEASHGDDGGVAVKLEGIENCCSSSDGTSSLAVT